MYIKQLILFIYIVSIQIFYSNGLNTVFFYTYENITDYIVLANKYHFDTHIIEYDKYNTLNKRKVLKFKNHINLSYYCKDDICVRVDRNNFPEFVEIPDKNGNIKTYISRSFSYEDLKLHTYSYLMHSKYNICLSSNGQLNNQGNEICYTEIYISFKCTSNSQCLTNKCTEGFCVFNEENPSEFCTDIYRYIYQYIPIFGRRSYMHCGKEIGDLCKTDNECGSKKCLKDGTCGAASAPSDTDGLYEFIFLICSSSIIFIILCLYYCIKLIIIIFME